MGHNRFYCSLSRGWTPLVPLRRVVTDARTKPTAGGPTPHSHGTPSIAEKRNLRNRRNGRKNQTNDHGPHTTKRPYSRQRVPSASNLPLFISQPNSLLHHSKRKPYSRQRVPSASNLPLFTSQPSSLLHHSKRKPYSRQRVSSAPNLPLFISQPNSLNKTRNLPFFLHVPQLQEPDTQQQQQLPSEKK